MKKLIVPYLPTLDMLDVSSASFLMEYKAQREHIDVANWKEFPYKPIAVFSIARSMTYLYIHYFVRGNSLRAVYDTHNSPVHRDSCVEFFMQQEGHSQYMNFEFNCIGTCDASRRESRDVKKSLSPAEYASIQIHTSLEAKPFVEQHGTHAWDLTVAIPFALMGLNAAHLPEKIRGNFYKCADNTEFPHYLSWSPIPLPFPDFHCPEHFGDIYF